MRSALIATVACAPLLAQLASPPERSANVKIHVVDQRGFTLEGCRVDRFFGRDGADLAGRFRGLEGTHIPWGLYSYTLKRRLPDGRDGTGSGRIAVTAGEMLFVVQAASELIAGISASRAVPIDFAIRGRLEPAPIPKSEIDPVWIRLSPVHGTFEWDVSVDRSGEFRIQNPLVGLYLLSVIEGDQVLHVQPIDFGQGFRSENVVVKLANEPPVISLQKEKQQ